jgi:hypothetical protein
VRTRNFAVGSFVALTFLGTVNLFSYYRMPAYSTIDDGFVGCGWPFWLYASGGFAHYSFIIWTGVLGNVVVALCAGRVLGWVLEKALMNRSALNRGAVEHVVGPERGKLPL